MYEAYRSFAVASKLPLSIGAITARSDGVLTGTKNGYLLTYSHRADQDPSPSQEFSVQVCKNFAKKTIVQLEVVPECHVLISLSDGLISVHDSDQVNIPVITSLQKAKGATCFAVSVEEIWADNSLSFNLKICVAIRRKIILFIWQAREFVEIQNGEFNFQDSPRCMSWAFETVALGIRDDYFLISTSPKTNTQSQPSQPIHLFTTGTKSCEPQIIFLEDREIFGFLRDDRLLFRNSDGEIVPEQPEILWGDVPNQIAYDAPYLVAALAKHVEIRSVCPTTLIQVIDISKPELVTCPSSCVVYIASSKDIWCLIGRPNLRQNLQKLIKDSQYELAIQLSGMIMEDTEEERAARVREIKNLYAFHLFTLKKYEAAFAVYRELNAEILYVSGLFPGLLPDDCRLNINYPGKLPSDLTGKELITGLTHLQKYLVEVRTNIARELEQENKRVHEAHDDGVASLALLSETEIREYTTLIQILDTTLLKCYVQTNEMLVSSLLRLQDNNCNVIECERVLLKHKKYPELFLLYERKNMHKEALDLLQQQAHVQDSSLRGLDRTIHYLQNLGPNHIDLIFQYSCWVLRSNLQEGLKIFTEDVPEVESLPRERVIEFLRKNAFKAVIPYLEHILENWQEHRPMFHDILAEHYVSQVKDGMTDYLQSLPEGHTVAPVCKEPGELGTHRKKLITFLETSKSYSPELLLVLIPHDAMFEERALLLGRLGRHEQAIAIYTNILLDYDQAERYCRLNFSKTSGRPEDAQVYLILFRMYAHPPDNAIIGLMQSRVPKPSPDVHLALRVLKDYAPYIDTLKAVELLSPDIHLESLWCALETILQSTSIHRRSMQIKLGLQYAQHLKISANGIRAQSTKIVIDHESSCCKCNKRIGNSAFARFADGQLVHYYCYKQDIAR